MQKSQRLKNISKVAQHHEQESGRQLAHSRHQAEHQQQQLQQLRQYRDEYKQQFQTLAGEGINARQLADFRTFLSKLNDAIEQQSQSADNSQTALDNSHQLWLEAHQRVKALNKAVEKRRSDEVYAANKAEQQASDEHAMRMGGYKK